MHWLGWWNASHSNVNTWCIPVVLHLFPYYCKSWRDHYNSSIHTHTHVHHPIQPSVLICDGLAVCYCQSHAACIPVVPCNKRRYFNCRVKGGKFNVWMLLSLEWVVGYTCIIMSMNICCVPYRDIYCSFCPYSCGAIAVMTGLWLDLHCTALHCTDSCLLILGGIVVVSLASKRAIQPVLSYE